MTTLVSLFDLTGYAVEEFTRMGWRTIIIDTQHTHTQHPRATEAIGLEINDESEQFIRTLRPDMLFSFPPCTDMAVSGAPHFAKKRDADPLFQEKAAYLARAAQRIGDDLDIPYMVENPVSVLSTLWRTPDIIFNPYEYGGYLPEDDVHPEYPQYILPRDAYPKRTCWWLGGGFVMPEKNPVPVAEGYSLQHKKLGGKSLRTKNIRSATPRGVFRAVASLYDCD